MNKIISRIAVVAAAVTTFASCQMEIADLSTETLSVNLNLNADVEQTKTYLDENNTVLWGKDEAVTLYVGSGETAKFFDSASTDVYDGEASASFTFEIKDVAQAESYALGGIYPASAAMDDNNDPKKFKAILPQTQNAEEGKYDPAAYIMVLKPDTVEELPSEYQASFRRATALNKITLTNVREGITTVEIIVPEGKALAGRRYFDLTDGSSGEIYYGQSNTITVNSQYTGSTIDVWFSSWGVELAAGEELTVRMKNAKKSYTRTIQANENGIKFVEGDLNTLKINMASATEESFENFAGEWLITGTTDGVTYAASSYESGNNLKATVTITVSDDVIPEVDGLENCKMLFTKVTEGEYEGMYTIQDANGKFLYAAASDKNQLKAGASASSAHYYWTVECNDGKYSVVASKSSNRNVMQFNLNNGSPIFSCYGSASQTAIVLYPYSMVKPDTTPRISFEKNSDQVTADATSYEFKYTTKNITGNVTAAVKDGATMTNVSASASNGTVTVKFDANADAEQKTATIVLSYEGAVSQEFVLTQAGKAPETGGQVEAQETLAFSSRYSSNTVLKGQTVQATNFNVSFAGDGTSAQYYTTGTAVRAYAKNTFTVSSNNTIVKVVITFGSSDGSNAITTDIGSYQNGTWTGSSKSVKFTVGGTSGNRRISAITVHYLNSTSGDGNEGGETPDPTPDPEEPSTGVSKTAKITFGSNDVKISAASVTGTDSENNNWTITTVGTTSYTSNSAYYQVGSSSKPATSITFTTTLPAGASVSNVEAKFGGFSSTAGNVTLKVGDTSVGTGKLNATSDVIVKSTSTASGNKVTVTVTDIAKGVKCYYVSVNYTE